MARSHAIAVAQTVPVRGDVRANVDQHLRLVDAAADGGAQVLVFPELSLTGYEMDLASGLAFTEDDPRLQPLLDASSSHAMTLVAGAPVIAGASLHIGAFIISPAGTVALYTKHHLGAFSSSAAVDGIVPPPEATFFRPGTDAPLLDVGGSLAAVAVCADTGRPSHPQSAAARGAKAYLASMFVIPSEFDGDEARLQRYAVEHQMIVAMANYGGPSGGLAAAGRSAIWSPAGERLVQLESYGPGVGVAVEYDDRWRGQAIVLAPS